MNQFILKRQHSEHLYQHKEFFLGFQNSLSFVLIIIILLQSHMISPKQVKSKSSFYRGISLKQYFRRTPESPKHQQYRDQETILLDDNKQPLIIADSFINISTQQDIQQIRTWPDNQDRKREFYIVNRKFHLPSLLSKKQTQTKSNSLNTDRRSTQESLQGEGQSRINKLPVLKQSPLVRQRNITMASRSSSRSTCCRQKITKIIQQVPEEVKLSKSSPEKLQSKTQNAEHMRKESYLKKRYGLRGGSKYQEANMKYFDKASSKMQ